MVNVQKTVLDGITLELRVLLNLAKVNVLDIETDDTYIKVASDTAFNILLIEDLKKSFLHTDMIDLVNAHQLIFVEGGKLHIHYNWVFVFQKVYWALNKFGKHPMACTITDDTLYFKYSRRRNTRSFEQLMIIQDFINPGRMLTDNLFVIGMNEDYTMYVKLDKGRAA